MSQPHLNEDFLDLLGAFMEAEVRFVVVGAHALAVHGVPRATGDLDVFVEPTLENGERVLCGLRSFGAPVDSHGVRSEDLAVPGIVYQVGLPPRRIDIITAIDGVPFEHAWKTRIVVSVSDMPVPILGR